MEKKITCHLTSKSHRVEYEILTDQIIAQQPYL